ncbi:hypothetical protein HL653_03585 [Sphingomonas sp. AP4-R1]|uniref:hypothetical protein n=1 Tax=Sphingomonas sp. AP4-R1 TaxID=2735134 RepID=UPI0014933634|nr:hypothetical protein [Sphingomonas sp. AP4-R1]QJU56989.1 hypothetical protein HL653_03585 [Sphingomonas sp. AP4-R1]
MSGIANATMIAAAGAGGDDQAPGSGQAGSREAGMEFTSRQAGMGLPDPAIHQ